MVLLVRLGFLGLLALSQSVLAIPQGFGGAAATKAGTTLVKSATVAGSAAPTSIAPQGTATPSQAPATTTLASVPNSVIDLAVITDLPPLNPTLQQIQGAPLSGVLSARPDLQSLISSQPAVAQSITNNSTASKRDMVEKRQISSPGVECVNNGGPKISVANWLLAAGKICNHWFPNPNLVTYVPSGSGFTATFSLGFGLGITLTFGYGVSDLGSGFLFYEPFSNGICLADLTNLIHDMDNQCLTDDGVNLDFVPLSAPDISPFSPSLKFYSFHD